MAEQGSAGVVKGRNLGGASGRACEGGVPEVSRQAGHDSGHLLLSASDYSRANRPPGENPNPFFPQSLQLIYFTVLCTLHISRCIPGANSSYV